MRRTRSRSRRGMARRPEVVSEDENEDRVFGQDDGSEEGYEFDVQLKVWRRSRANMWRSPSFD